MSLASRSVLELMYCGVHLKAPNAWTRPLNGIDRDYRWRQCRRLREKDMEGNFAKWRPCQSPAEPAMLSSRCRCRCADRPVLVRSWHNLKVAARQSRKGSRELGSSQSTIWQRNGVDHGHAAQQRLGIRNRKSAMSAQSPRLFGRSTRATDPRRLASTQVHSTIVTGTVPPWLLRGSLTMALRASKPAWFIMSPGRGGAHLATTTESSSYPGSPQGRS